MNNIEIIVKIWNGDTYSLGKEAISDVTWNGDISVCSRQLTFVCSSDLDIPISSLITFKVNGQVVFIGRTFERTKVGNSKFVEYLAYDIGEKLNKIKVSYNTKGKLPHNIVTEILTQYEFKIGYIEPINIQCTEIIVGYSIYDLIRELYEKEEKRTGKKFWIYVIGEQIYIQDVEKSNVISTTFEEGYNIYDISVKESKADMVNRVLIVDENGNVKDVVENKEDIIEHTLFQEVYQESEGVDSKTEAKALLNGMEQTYEITGYGDITCLTGNTIYIKESTTNTVGLFLIEADNHTWSEGSYKTDLTLKFLRLR